MRKTTPLGTTSLPAPNGHIVLTVNVEHEPADFTTNTPAATAATAATDNVHITFCVVGTVAGHTVDLGVRRSHVPVRGIPADLEELTGTEPVAGLIAEYRQRITELTLQLARLLTGVNLLLAYLAQVSGRLAHQVDTATGADLPGLSATDHPELTEALAAAGCRLQESAGLVEEAHLATGSAVRR